MLTVVAPRGAWVTRAQPNLVPPHVPTRMEMSVYCLLVLLLGEIKMYI